MGKLQVFRPAWLPLNQNGGYYSPGKRYELGRKLEVFDACCFAAEDTFPLKPSARVVAKEARVGYSYARKVIAEIEEFGGVIDPDDLKAAQKEKHDSGVGCNTLMPAHETFLLALHAVNPGRPLSDHVSSTCSFAALLLTLSAIFDFI